MARGSRFVALALQLAAAGIEVESVAKSSTQPGSSCPNRLTGTFVRLHPHGIRLGRASRFGRRMAARRSQTRPPTSARCSPARERPAEAAGSAPRKWTLPRLPSSSARTASIVRTLPLMLMSTSSALRPGVRLTTIPFISYIRHDGARHEAVAKGLALEHVQHAIHLVADAHKLAYRVPTRQHKPRPPSSAFTCTSIGCVPHSIVTLGELNQKDINAA